MADILREINEIKLKLSYMKRIGFFFGAGTSCSVGVPDIASLTNRVYEKLKETDKDLSADFDTVQNDLKTNDNFVNIELILNHTRLIRRLTADRTDKTYLEITGEKAKALDDKICTLIYHIINEQEENADIASLRRFFGWLHFNKSEFIKEIFTTNYDLLFERSLESLKLPYFDGFVGSYEPFFIQEAVQKTVGMSDLTRDWIRLWKLHGSLNWFWKEDKSTDSKIIRTGKLKKKESVDGELVIYPSRDKYDLSKKQPYTAYFDRLRDYLTNGEGVFIVSGYSFSDEHINEIFFDALRQNNRLHMMAFFYQTSQLEELARLTNTYLNLSLYGPQSMMVNGSLEEWDAEAFTNQLEDDEVVYWNKQKKSLTLGDFTSLVNFLVQSSGVGDAIEALTDGKR